jgi:murein peptide amidase A
MQMRPAPAALLTLVALVLAACSDGSDSSANSSLATSPPPALTTSLAPEIIDDPPPTSLEPSTEPSPAPSSAPSSDVPTTEAPATTEVPESTSTTTDESQGPAATDDEWLETRLVGRSVQDRPIIAERRGTPGGRVVLVIGVIHGDENDGLAIMDRLHTLDVPGGVDLWLIDSMNPDGLAADDRHNANDVDLNRNFPQNWGPLGEPGDGEYAGPSAASEPETQAMMDFITEIRPDIIIWYHQDLYRISPGRGRDGLIRQRYAELTGLPLVSITGGTYTGVAATWARMQVDPGVAFIVELGSDVSEAEADVHAEAVLTVAREDN